MFSGKSERLLDRIAKAKAQAILAAAFKHAFDDRYHAQQIVTHSGRRIEATAVTSATTLLELVGDARLVVIDEAQFFGVDLAGICKQLAEDGRTVIVAGLDRDSWGEPFGPMPGVAAIADRVVRTTGRCASCGGVADHTQRVTPIVGERMTGGPEAYEPRCAKCFVPPPAELRR